MTKARRIGIALTDVITRYALAALVMLAIAYGSLYPFSFLPSGTIGAGLLHLLGTWKQPPQSRGDFLINLLLYVPFGLTISTALRQSVSDWRWITVSAVSAGAALSFSIEWTQFYDASRVSALSDFYLNVAGTLAGSSLARVAVLRSPKVSWPSGSSPAFARLLLLAWLGWRLYPYAPTIDLHKYWRSLKPVFLAPTFAPYDIFRYAVLWLSVALLLQIGLKPKKPMPLLLPAMLGFFMAKILIVGQTITLPEVLGAISVIIFGDLLLMRRGSVGIIGLAALVMTVVILSRVLPWHLETTHRAFQWIPFFGFLHGSLQVDTISFAEKFYLYGVLLLLLVRAGMTLTTAVVSECAVLFATSMLQTFMMARSGEITDAAMAFILGLIYAIMRRQYSETNDMPLRGSRRQVDIGRS